MGTQCLSMLAPQLLQAQRPDAVRNLGGADDAFGAAFYQGDAPSGPGPHGPKVPGLLPIQNSVDQIRSNEKCFHADSFHLGCRS